MVVLESTGTVMTSTGHQYLQPDYLSPLPTTLDAKKSPLALLAQTCSQIGADSPNTKSLLPSLDKPKRSNERASTTPPKPAEPKQSLAFKPYEANVLSKKSETPRPPSKPAGSGEPEEKRRTPSRKSASPPKDDKSPASEKPKTPDSGASPIIRSGLEVLQGHPKDLPLGTFKPHLGHLGALPPGCCPPGLEANPAFRPPLAGFSHHHAAVLAAAAAAGYPAPYVGYARVKTATGAEALVPVCKDPYCGGCQLSVHSALMGGTCPSGCTQCEHQKYLAGAGGALVPPHPLTYQLGRPYVCNWISGDNYCGKRFTTSEELLQHLRTHTTGTDSTSLLNPLRYPNPPLSPLSAARFHPYSKPGAAAAAAAAGAGMPASIASPFSAFNPTALGPYYSPYALYGQRLGAAAAAAAAAAVHP